MLRVALTGGIASGKTIVSDRLRELGAVVVDADLLAREVVAPGTAGLSAVVDRFGASVLADGALDRAALGKVVFADPEARRDLERIIHPAVRTRAAQLEQAAPADAVVVQVIPLLVETGQQHDFDVVVVVDVDHATQLERLRTRNSLSAAEAESRLGAQASREQRLAAADIVLENSGTVAELQRDVDDLWPRLRSRASSS
jgi:dephospho-CoA kinase